MRSMFRSRAQYVSGREVTAGCDIWLEGAVAEFPEHPATTNRSKASEADDEELPRIMANGPSIGGLG
jgi:hypothetical protein